MSVPGEEERLVRVHDVIQQLPPPHYRQARSTGKDWGGLLRS